MSTDSNNMSSTPNFSVLGRFRRRIRHQNPKQSKRDKLDKELTLCSNNSSGYHQKTSSDSHDRMATSFDSGLSDGTLDSISSCSSTTSVNSSFSSSSASYSSCNSCGCPPETVPRKACVARNVKLSTRINECTDLLASGRKERRGGVQLKSLGTDFTIKGGQWKLWVS